MPSLLSNYTENNTGYMTRIKYPWKTRAKKPNTFAEAFLLPTTVGKAFSPTVMLLAGAFARPLTGPVCGRGAGLLPAVGIRWRVSVPIPTAVDRKAAIPSAAQLAIRPTQSLDP